MTSRIEARLLLVISCLAFSLLISFFFFGFIIPQTPARMLRSTVELFELLPFWSTITSSGMPVPRTSGLVAALILVMSAFCFLAYGIAVYLGWRFREHEKLKPLVFAASIVFFFLTIWFLPNFNTDVYNYIMRGRVAAVYDSNPYYDAVDNYADDPVYEYASSRYTSEPGGKFPGWMHLNVLLADIAGNNPVNNLLLYRGFFFLVNVINIALLWLIVRKLNRSYVLPAVLMYAWNPIVVLNGQSKTDTVMVFYLLSGVLLMVYERHRLSIAALTMSVLVKFVTLPVLALCFLRDIALRRWKALCISAIVIASTATILYAPFWNGPGILVNQLAAVGTSGSSVPTDFRWAILVFFCVLTVLIGFTQNGSTEKLLGGCALLLIYFSLFLTKVGFAWYLMTLIAVVSLGFSRVMTVLMIVLSFSSFLFNVWYSTFSSQFKYQDVFEIPKILVYVSLPAIVLSILAFISAYKKWKTRNRLTLERDFSDSVMTNNHLANGSTKKILRILTYHRIANPEDSIMLDPRIISSTPAVFEQHIEFLKKDYDVVSMDDVFKAATEGQHLPRKALLITFDDAYCDFKDNAWPILKRSSVPATVFVPTAYPDDETRSFWWDKLYRAVMNAERDQLTLNSLGALSLRNKEEREQSLRRLQQFVKTQAHAQAMAFVEEVCRELDDERPPHKTVLGWDELRQLARDGVTLGAHTKTHPIMTKLTSEQLREEIVGSYSDLKREIGNVLPIFCYPNGSHNDDVVRVLKDENFKLAFTVNDGHNDLNTTHLLRLRRTNVTRKSTVPVLKLRLNKWFTYIDMWRHRERKKVSHR